MSYSISFFAVDAKSLAHQFPVAAGGILKRIEQRLREEEQFDDDEIRSTLDKAAAICRGQLPKECDTEYFDALCWIAEVVGEKIDISSFIDFKHYRYLAEIGIWPWLLRSRPPFAVPVCQDPPPEVGFLSAEDIAKFALPSFANLPPIGDRRIATEVSYARQEFQEVLESLAEDQLDLLAVLI